MSELLTSHEEEQGVHEWFKSESLRLLKQQLASVHYPGYPVRRLSYANGAGVLYDGGRLHLPLGEWETRAFPNTPGEAGSARLQAIGYRLDGLGRPLHPWIDDMLADQDIGVVTGRGYYRQWGANFTADPIIIREDTAKPHVLLIRRKDTGMWALPGGFVEPGEAAAHAALREAREETLLDLAAYRPALSQLYDGPLGDLRVTAHAWPHTTAFVGRLDPQLSRYLPLGEFAGNPEEVDRVGWFPLREAQVNLFGSHSLLIALAGEVL